DVIRRYHLLKKDSVLYLCGADENALKIFQAAEKAGVKPQEFTDQHNKEFLEVAKQLNVHFDVWQRGSDAAHHFTSSQKLWELCEKNGDIYKKSYTGLYCVGCEQFYEPGELNEKGECFEHPGKPLDKVSEENYFFKLSKYQTFLEDLIEQDKLKITPLIRKNEALAFIRKGLEDFSISRSRERARGWGIPVPGDTNQIMYVWFDALNIYQTGIGFGWDEKTYKTWSPQDVMVIGKGIIRFHAVYWPAILKSARLGLPKELFVHGYLTVDGQKMSKTLGNVVDPVDLIEKYGTDTLRYYLLREIPSTADGDFSESRLKEIYNADLANNLGNLAARIAKLCETSQFSQPARNTEQTHVLSDSVYEKALLEYRFNDALAFVWQKITAVNQYIDREKPWNLQKTGDARIKDVLAHCIDELQEIGSLLLPFLPHTAERILAQFGKETISSQTPLFPRLT
ncbi:MAG: methionine--tRNA ligase, partial [Patescibacteria group bacterium]|nr:methionine--tRNA ligase [Patescibacteria group bacterium]